MADLFGESIEQAILDLFRQLGSDVSLRELAQKAIDLGILTEEVLAGITLRGVVELCRRALKTETADGLPFAKPTGDGDRWKQLDLFSYEQAAALIIREADGWIADYKKLRRLVEWCQVRFGRAPKIPQLSEDF